MSLCPVLNVGAPGGQPDVNSINAALATIRAILNGDIDAANVENGSILLAKLATGIGVVVPMVLWAHAPVAGAYAIPALDGFVQDAASFRAKTSMTIVKVCARRTTNQTGCAPGLNLDAQIHIDGVAQPTTKIVGVPELVINDVSQIDGLNIAVAAGQKVSLRIDATGGALDERQLPVEYWLFCKIGLS